MPGRTQSLLLLFSCVMLLVLLSNSSQVRAAAPSITPTPSSGPLGTSVTVAGSGFATSSTVTITLGGVSQTTSPSPCSTSGSGAISCSFTVPESSAGTRIITATDSHGNTASAAFTVTPPTIQLSPTSGPQGTSVTVTGSGFAPSSPITVNYGSTTVSSSSSTTSSGAFQVTFTVPASAGSQTVTATDSYGNTARATFGVSTPSMSANPTSGPIGTQVTLTGNGFAPSASVSITFGTTKLSTSCNSTSAGGLSCTFTVPRSLTGSQTVTATDSYGNTASSSFTVTAPTLSLNPSTGPIGTSVTATGNGYPASASVTIAFNGAAQPTSPSTCVIGISGALNCSFNVPSSPAGAQRVVATDSSGNTANATFTVTAPTLSLSINSGIVGQSVTITGNGFLASSSIALLYDGTPLSESIPPTNAAGYFQGTLTVPASSAGPHTVTATDAAGNRASQTFTVGPAASLSPGSGFVGTSVTVTGSGFTASSVVSIAFNRTAVSTTPSPCGVSAVGGFSCSFAVPQSAAAGNATVTVTDSASDTVQRVFFVSTVTFTLNLVPGQGAQSLSSSNSFTISYTHDGAPATLSVSGASYMIQADLQTTVTISAMSSGSSSSTEEWCLQVAGGACQSVSFTATSAGSTATFYYYDLLLQSVSYSVSPGSVTPPPVMAYLTAPSAASSVNSQVNASTPLTTLTQSVWATRGSVLAVTQMISGSTGERWATATSPFSVSTSNTLTVKYYQQYSQDISYRVVGRGQPQNATLSYTSFGNRLNSTLETTTQMYWIDSNSIANVTSALGGSSPTERWFVPTASFPVTGTDVVPTVLSYSQQFHVTISAQPTAGGSATPTSEWMNANASVPIIATPKLGWSFQGWNGQGTGSYSGTNSSWTIEVDGAIVQNAIFYPGLLVSASAGGHVSYSYSSAAGVVKPNTNGTIYLPAATAITLTAVPESILYTFRGWTGGVNSTSDSVSITTVSPTAVRATFGFNLFLLGIFSASGLTATPLLASLWVGIRQKYRVGQVVWYNNEPWIVTSFSKGKRGKIYNLRTTRSQSGALAP